MVQVGGRRRQAGRQPVRDRDRQGVDGGAVDHRRRARGNPRGRGRGRAGRRRGRGDRGRGGRERVRAPQRPRRQAPPHPSPPPDAPPRAPLAAGPAAAAIRRRSARSVFRGAHAGAQYGPARLPGGMLVTPLARRLAGEAASICRASRPRAPMAASSRADVESALASGGAPRRAGMATGASVDQVKALYRDVPFEEVPLDGMRADDRHAAGAGEADHPAFLSDRRCRDRRAPASCASRPMPPRPRTRTVPAFKLSVNDFVIKAWAARCSACPPRTRCGPETASCASSIPISASRSRSRAA